MMVGEVDSMFVHRSRLVSDIGDLLSFQRMVFG
jgi:hypothetical protein